jgi:tetratricopeptide (TPR) repeat protein
VVAVGATTEQDANFPFDSGAVVSAAPFFALETRAYSFKHDCTASMKSSATAVLFVTACLFLAGCKPSGKSGNAITELQRKEAAHAESEAQFAVTMRQWDRAEPLYAKAAQLCPDTGVFWVGLGLVRVRLGKHAAAKDAYQNAVKAYAAEAEKRKDDAELWLKQAEILALLGRATEGRAILEKAAKQFPNDRTVRPFAEKYDRMIADPNFLLNAVKS